MFSALSLKATPEEKNKHYQLVIEKVRALIAAETDWIAAMATVACELHHSFSYFHWTGFYRTVEPKLLKIGPYQGTHGCLVIPFGRGVCGAAALSQKTQLEMDVNKIDDHIACSATTQSEIVVPIVDADGKTQAVLDVDSDNLAAFDQTDRLYLEKLAAMLSQKYFA